MHAIALSQDSCPVMTDIIDDHQIEVQPLDAHIGDLQHAKDVIVSHRPKL